MVPQGSGGELGPSPLGGGGETQDPVIVTLYFRQDYLYVKLQEVHQVTEEMEVTQEEMKARLRWADAMSH